MTGGNRIYDIPTLVRNNVPMIKVTNEVDGTDIAIDIRPAYLWTNNTIATFGEPTGNINNKFTWHSTSTESNLILSINELWRPFIQFSTISNPRINITTVSFIEGINPNVQNSEGQTLLYLATQNNNKVMFDALVAMGSSIIHSIALGKPTEQG